MPYFITSHDREKARSADIRDIDEFLERKGEDLFGEGVGDRRTFAEKCPYKRLDEDENGIQILSNNLVDKK